jgi:hypothetical protein
MKILSSLRLIGLAAAASFLVAAQAQGDIPRPEHPRPDAFRTNWLNLNGEWQFEVDAKNDGEARGITIGKNLSSKIIVPFCPESKLSGIGSGNETFMKYVWYRKVFEVPDAMKGKRILLHFGGVDYKTTVYVNGKQVGTHIGENAQFDFDITGSLRDGQNEIVVHVFDDTASGNQPTGKQAHNKSEGCVYTRTTGIWQTVWLEAVGSSYVDNFSVVPDPDKSRVFISASVNGLDKNLKLVVEAFANGKKVGSETVKGPWRDQQIILPLSKKFLWDTKDPFLYDLKFTLYSDGRKIDELAGYFGLRKVTIEGRRILINGKPVFQRLILDQGFYPDGVWTAPSDSELKADIERSMAAGYNGARLHQKVFEPRFLYWADKMGYLVWGEFPNWGYNYKSLGYAPYVTEWTEILLRDRNHPAIIGWCPFNETPGEAAELQQVIWNVTKAVDPSRPVLETSGWSHSLPNPEVRDTHDYDQNPDTLRARYVNYFKAAKTSSMPARYGATDSLADCGVPFMISEFGGIGWATEGGWGYGTGPKTLEEFYARYKGLVDAQLDNPNLFGFCYTQLTDVEQEHNGLYYYDRRPKFNMARLHEITSREAAYERGEPTAPQPSVEPPAKSRVLVGAAADGALAKPYHYTTTAPDATWNREGFDDHDWKTGMAPFGQGVGQPKTQWSTSDIFLRQTFEFDGADIKVGSLVIFNDEDTEVYVNGQKVLSLEGYATSYRMHEVTEALRKALRKGTNTLAIHTHQTGGGQYIDLAILVE